MCVCVYSLPIHVNAHSTSPAHSALPHIGPDSSGPPCSGVWRDCWGWRAGFEGGSSDSLPNNPPTLHVLYTPPNSSILVPAPCFVAWIADPQSPFTPHTHRHTHADRHTLGDKRRKKRVSVSVTQGLCGLKHYERLLCVCV